jgi:hypothetical protein
MHLIDAPELGDLRQLRDDWMAGKMTTAEYQQRYDAYIQRYETRPLCSAGDGRQATAMLRGVAYCSACWLRERGR